jgi:hypothetical protein
MNMITCTDTQSHPHEHAHMCTWTHHTTHLDSSDVHHTVTQNTITATAENFDLNSEQRGQEDQPNPHGKV